MAAKTSIRDLRNHFPRVRKLVETEGEVILTEKGEPKYRLVLYTAEHTGKAQPVDYWARLTAYMPDPLSDEEARALTEENRGER
jgi:antitoxin (DNA-binding transcriptional repressor) of toxin-antitoxin stability system